MIADLEGGDDIMDDLSWLDQTHRQVSNQSPESKVQRKGTGTGADNIILQAITTTTTQPLTFLT